MKKYVLKQDLTNALKQITELKQSIDEKICIEGILKIL